VELLSPDSIEDLHLALAEDVDTKILAGGTALVLMLKNGLIQPERLVSLGKIEQLKGIQVLESCVRIGARTSLAQVARHPAVQAQFPVLAQACACVGSVRIRNVATLGGNVAEADYASDPPGALVALDAQVGIAASQASRTEAVASLISGFYTTTLSPDELITHIDIPIPSQSARSNYQKFKSRSSEDRPCVGVATTLHLEDDNETIRTARVVVGAVAATPVRHPEIERELEGQRLTDRVIDRVAEGYAELTSPLSDLRATSWYRQQMIRHFVRQSLLQLQSESYAS
jgi:carbon-monoxide dehydrogenase medium subunit